MASCENPEHAALESELNDALEEALQMEERLAAYEAAGAGMGDGGGGGAAAAAKAAEEIAALTEQAATFEKERDTYEQDYLNKKDRVDELETQLEDKDQKTKELVSEAGLFGCRLLAMLVAVLVCIISQLSRCSGALMVVPVSIDVHARNRFDPRIVEGSLTPSTGWEMAARKSPVGYISYSALKSTTALRVRRTPVLLSNLLCV